MLSTVKDNLIRSSEGVQALSRKLLVSDTKPLERWEAVCLIIREELKIGLVILLREGQYIMVHSCYGGHDCYFGLQTKQLEALSHEL